MDLLNKTDSEGYDVHEDEIGNNIYYSLNTKLLNSLIEKADTFNRFKYSSQEDRICTPVYFGSRQIKVQFCDKVDYDETIYNKMRFEKGCVV